MRRWMSITFVEAYMLSLVAVIGSGAVWGQGGAVGLERQRVAIVDFSVAGGIQSVWGRTAADAVANEIIAVQMFDVLPRQTVEQTIVALKLTKKVTVSDLIRLGSDLNAHVVLTGKVISLEVERRPRVAHVHEQVLLYEVATGEVINGANVKQSSLERPGADDHELINEAFTRAATEVIRQFQQWRPPEAQVLGREAGRRVVLNKGFTEGVIVGTRMSVVRSEYDERTRTFVKRKIGQIIVEESDQRQSIAKIESELTGIRPTDKARGIFSMPTLLEVRRGERVRPRPPPGATLVQRTLLPILFLGGVATIVAGGREAEKAPEGPIAAAQSAGVGTVLRFGTGKGTVLGVEIYRSESAFFAPDLSTRIDIVKGNISQYGDTTRFYEGSAETEAPDDPSIPPQLIREEEDRGRHLTMRSLGRNRMRRRGYVQRSRQEVIPADEYEQEFIHTPLVLGVPYFYMVRRISARRTPGAGLLGQVGGGLGGGGGGTEMEPWEIVLSEYSRTFGPATPLRLMGDSDLISPPNVPAPGSEAVNLADVTFRFLSVLGADTYSIFVSDRIDFPHGRTISIPLPPFTEYADGVLIEHPVVNVLNQTFTTVSTLFWSVGYRRSLDQAFPYPLGYVFSVIHSFRPAPSPPQPPGGRELVKGGNPSSGAFGAGGWLLGRQPTNGRRNLKGFKGFKGFKKVNRPVQQ